VRKPVVVIGHSMGGCISRLLITDADDKLWMRFFEKPPEQVPLSSETRTIVTDALIFQHRQEVGRVIFISVPLRGSDLASNWLGRFGSSLVRSPIALLKAGRDIFKIATFRTGDLKRKRIPNSVDTLAPTNRFVIAINTIPITPGIPYHTIMGDRGKGDAPNSSDGIVPYWSSHMDGPSPSLSSPQVMAQIRTRRLSRKFAAFSCSTRSIANRGKTPANDPQGKLAHWDSKWVAAVFSVLCMFWFLSGRSLSRGKGK
jgi:hypothetical protein